MKYLFTAAVIFFSSHVNAQQTDKPFIKLTEPLKEKVGVKTSRQFIVGSVCKSCNLTINSLPVKVYPTGAFAYELNLKPGDTSFNLVAFAAPGKSAAKQLQYTSTLPAPPDTVKTLDIASIETFPEDNLMLQPGDKIIIVAFGNRYQCIGRDTEFFGDEFFLARHGDTAHIR